MKKLNPWFIASVIVSIAIWAVIIGVILLLTGCTVFAPPWRTDYPNNSLPLRYGNGNEQVLSGGTNGGQVPVMGTLTFAASGNSVASATGVFSFYVLKV